MRNEIATVYIFETLANTHACEIIVRVQLRVMGSEFLMPDRKILLSRHTPHRMRNKMSSNKKLFVFEWQKKKQVT